LQCRAGVGAAQRHAEHRARVLAGATRAQHQHCRVLGQVYDLVVGARDEPHRSIGLAPVDFEAERQCAIGGARRTRTGMGCAQR